MRQIFYLVLALFLGLSPGLFASSGYALTLGEKASLQAALQRHVDRQMVGGVYLYLDASTGETKSLHPVTAHPMIMQMGDKFVLCFDFRDGKGKTVEVDYYLAAKNNSYVVYHTAINNRQLLMRLVKAGKVKRAE